MVSTGEKMCLQEINTYAVINICTNVLTLFTYSAKDCSLYHWFYQFLESLFQPIVLILFFVALDSEFKAPEPHLQPLFSWQNLTETSRMVYS